LKKLIIYSGVPISNDWACNFGIFEFSKYGFDVEIWSAAEFLCNSDKINLLISISNNDLANIKNLTIIKSFDDLELKVRKLDSNTVFWIIDRGSMEKLNLDNRDLDILNKYNIKYVCQHLLPYFSGSKPLLKIRYHVRELRRYICNYKKKPCLIFGTGSEGRKQVMNTFKNNSNYKSVPSLVILWLREQRQINEKYIVYVDEAVNYSRDTILFGHEKVCNDLEGFYTRINQVFENIENLTGFKIIIAASSKYHYNSNPFQNRRIIYNKTQNLIQHSELVIGHKSTILWQATVENKPLFLFYDISLRDLKNKHIYDLSKVFGINAIWTNQLTKSTFEKSKVVNVIYNKKLVKKYLKEDGISGSFIENVSSALNQI
jgi:hypothetical protein